MRPPATFVKLEGLGNDFILIEADLEHEVTPEQARLLCDRRFGVGGDGVLLLLPPRNQGSEARMKVINSDGSIPEMCGNGIRCAALHLALRRGLERGEVVIDTDAGARRCAFERKGEAANIVVDMGLARVLDDVTVEVGNDHVALTRVDVGNPHAVAFRAVTREQFERLGPTLSTSPAFEHGANVEFVRLVEGGLDVSVWERGAGATLACGTGACAAVAAAQAKGLLTAAGPVNVHLHGGDLEIVRDHAGRVTMRGPARRVFAGSLLGLSI